jgi:serine/threonine protein kinase
MTPETIAHYRITAMIGSGGMGEVYRARDTKLGRDVAIKILPPAFASDANRMARFEREARVLASLNHPNIAHIYGVEERALVMELVEGQNPKGPMPFDEAWKIALQIADALEYAHDKGVVHRDLKPANVKVTPEGVVKLLDFGLAKAYSNQPDAASGDPSHSPTLTLGATVAGTIMGTAAYMSPEQARGKTVDKRADIWSWGVVLYELLTGERMFQGEDAAETLAAVIHKQPDLDKAPPQVRMLLGRCLEKDPKKRLRDISVAKELLEEKPQVTAHSRTPLPWIAAAAVLAIIAAIAGFITWRHLREEPPALAKLSFPAPDHGFEPIVPTEAVAPNGRSFAFVAKGDKSSALWVRNLNDPTPRKLADVGPNGGEPFWSPDTRRLAMAADGALKIFDVNGGPPVTIASVDNSYQTPGMGSWNQDDVVLFSEANMPIYRVPAHGGSPSPVTELDQTKHELGHAFPWFLPDGRHFLYMVFSTDPANSGVYVGDLASKTRKQVLAFGTRTTYVNPGYLLFVRGQTLFAQRFDAGKLEVTGDAIPVAEGLNARNTTIGNGTLGHFSASQNGVLAYTTADVAGNVQLTWFDRKGNKTGSIGAPGRVRWLSLSPDESRVAYSRADTSAAKSDVWIWDVAHGFESQFTSEGDKVNPVWSYDGAYLFFGGARGTYWKRADGTGSEEIVAPTGGFPMDASRDGQYLFTTNGERIWVVPLTGDRKPFQYRASQAGEINPTLSPDGRWLAYSSTETPYEIYVVSFPQPGGKWQVSKGGGARPVWSHDGRELYYYNAQERKVLAVEITPGKEFQFGDPKPLFDVKMTDPNSDFAVTKDGRFLVPVQLEPAGGGAPMTVVLNWPEMLPKK